METNSNFSKLIDEAVKKGLTPYGSALNFMNNEVAKQFFKIGGNILSVDCYDATFNERVNYYKYNK